MCYTGRCKYENRWTGECKCDWGNSDALCNIEAKAEQIRKDLFKGNLSDKEIVYYYNQELLTDDDLAEAGLDIEDLED